MSKPTKKMYKRKVMNVLEEKKVCTENRLIFETISTSFGVRPSDEHEMK